MKLAEDEYCRHFKISKEILSSRIRTKKVECVVDNGIKYILFTPNEPIHYDKASEISKEVISPSSHTLTLKSKVTVATILALYHKENAILKRKIVQLETKVDRLTNEKEQLLKDELDKLENFYIAKDRQLKNILELVNNKMISDKKESIVHEVQSYNDFIDDNGNKQELIELKEYLKSLGLKSTKRKAIKKRFLDLQDGDIRIIQQGTGLYLDFSRYDYSDLLA